MPATPHGGPPHAPALRQPRAFKIVELSSGALLAEDADARATIDLLSRIDSIFDVSIYVWHVAAQAWRQLTVGEQRTLWDFRGR